MQCEKEHRCQSQEHTLIILPWGLGPARTGRFSFGTPADRMVSIHVRQAQIKSGGAGQADRPHSSFSDTHNFWKINSLMMPLVPSHARLFSIRATAMQVVCANFSDRKSKKNDLSKFRVFLSAPADFICACLMYAVRTLAFLPVRTLSGDGVFPSLTSGSGNSLQAVHFSCSQAAWEAAQSRANTVRVCNQTA